MMHIRTTSSRDVNTYLKLSNFPSSKSSLALSTWNIHKNVLGYIESESLSYNE